MTLVTSGISGLDALLGGGFPSGRAYLIKGTPGTGKTIFGVQFLYNGVIHHNENGLLVSLEYDPLDLKEDMLKFGWDLTNLEKEGRLHILGTAEPLEFGTLTTTSTTVDDLANQLQKAAQAINAKRIVIDSLSGVELGFTDMFESRKKLLRFCTLLKKLGCTIVFISEYSEPSNKFKPYEIDEFIANGVILVYYERIGSERFRGIEILKMRGMKHSTRIHAMEINNNGITVFPDEYLFSTET
jgi:KaiC/GvpD/RAD55 family RecA-like ATPase